MDPRQLLRSVVRRWKFVVVLMILGILGAGYLTSNIPSTYRSTVRIAVTSQATTTFTALYQGLYLDQRIASYAPLAGDPALNARVFAAVSPGLTAGEARPSISVNAIPGTGLLEIRVIDESPRVARSFAQAEADELVKLIESLESAKLANGDQSVSPVRVGLAGAASFNDRPIGPNLPFSLITGALLGLLIGVAGAVVRELYDSSIKSPRDLTRVTKSAVMSVIPFDRSVRSGSFVGTADGSARVAGSFEQLRTSLQFLNLDGRRRVIVVSSAMPDEGKTVTSTNVAMSVAPTGARVLIVDCDFRRPQVARRLGLENSVGLLTVLLGQASLADCIQEHDSGVHVLATGPAPPNPSEVLSTAAMADLINSLRDDYDLVIIDAPPLLAVTDPSVLAELSDGVLLVTRYGHTSESQVALAADQVKKAGSRLIGVVLNMAPRKMADGFGDGYGTEFRSNVPAAKIAKAERPRRSASRAPLSLRSVRRMVLSSLTWIVPLIILLLLVSLGSKSPGAGIFAIGIAAIGAIVLSVDLTRAGTAFMVLAMFLAPLNDLRLGTSQVTISDLVYVLAVLILVPTIVGNRIEIPPLFLLGLAVLLTMGILASAASPISAVSGSQVGRLIVGAFALPIFFMVWRPPMSTIVRFAGAYMFGTVFSVMYGLLHGRVGSGDARYVGYTTHPNFLGTSCLLAVALAPFMLAMVRPGYRWMFWGASLICTYGIWISGSRAALLVLGMLVFVYPFIERSIRAGAAVLLGVAGVLLLAGKIMQDDSNNALGRLFGNGSAEGSDNARKDLLVTAFQQFRNHPLLGNGFDGSIGAHNIYLQVAVAVGVFGLIGYLAIMWTALRPLFWTGTAHRLGYPVLAYMAIGPLTNTLWERLIWSTVGLTFAVNIRKPDNSVTSDVEPDREPVLR